jgi:putative spermidine/putrescine transport system permease protein
VKWWQINKKYALILPSLIFISLFMLFGMIHISILSLKSDGFSFIHYQNLFCHPFFPQSFYLSLKISLVATFLSLIIGILLTRILFYYLKNNGVKLLVWVPMLIPHFVAAYIILLFFSQTGIISILLFQRGLIKSYEFFPIMVNDPHGIGIILTYVWKSVPFVMLMLLPIYYQLNTAYFDLVKTMGGGSYHIFKDIEWPAIYPVVLETGIILFSYVLSAFEIPQLLGVTYPKLLPILAYEWYTGGNWSNRPMAMAMMVIITLFILFITYFILFSIQKSRLRVMKGR